MKTEEISKLQDKVQAILSSTIEINEKSKEQVCNIKLLRNNGGG